MEVDLFGVKEGDLVTARSLTATKLTGWLVPTGTAIAAFVESQTKIDGPLSGLTPGQKLTVWIAILAFVLVLVVVDVLARSAVTAASLRTAVSPLPPDLRARYKSPSGDIVDCSVAACRSFGSGGNDATGQFLIVPRESDEAACWVAAGTLTFPARTG
jgi:hypothetical protein